MSTLAKQVMEKAREKGAVREGAEFFSVTDKRVVDIGGGQTEEIRVPNGSHRVKILSEKLGKGKGYDGKEQDEMQMVVLDNGVEKLWNVALKNNLTGNVNYIIQALEGIEDGEEFIAEAFKMKNNKYGTKISKVAGHSSEVPTVQYDDSSEAGSPSLDEAEDVPTSQIPF